MSRKFFNYLIISFLLIVFITSCNLEGGIGFENKDSMSEDSFIEDSTERYHRVDDVKILNRVFNTFENGKIGLVLRYLDHDVEWIVEGDAAFDQFAGTYHGKREVVQYLREYYSLIDVTSIEVLNQIEEEGIITSTTRVYASVPAFNKSMNMEHIFYCEFNSRHKITKMIISFNNYSMNLALVSGGEGNIVSHISVSPEAAGLNWYFETYIKEFVRVAPVEVLRAAFDVPIPMSDIPSDGILEEVTINGIEGELMQTANASEEKVILYIHGGAFIIGDMAGYRLVTYNISKNTGIPVVAINYRRAPESPFSAAPVDCFAAYIGLLDDYDPEDIAIIGESAGGGLVFSTLLLAKENGVPLPAAGVSISPWADLSNSSESFTANGGTEVFLSPEVLNNAATMYLDGISATNPIASPVYANVDDLPPLYITTSSSEMLADDAATMFTKLSDANGTVTIEVGDGLIHCWPNQGLPESVAVYSRIFSFLLENLTE